MYVNQKGICGANLDDLFLRKDEIKTQRTR